MDNSIRIALLPSPGMGHLIPIIEFAKNLHHRHHICSTLLLPTQGSLSSAESHFLSTLPSPAVHCVLLPPANFQDLPPDVKIETRISLTISRSMPSIRRALRDIPNLAALVVDLFGTDAFDAALDLGIPPYIFFPSTAMALSLLLYLPKLHETVSCEYAEVPHKLHIPGCVPIDGKDLLDPLQDRQNEAYKWVVHHAKRYSMADGVLVNSFKELEPGAIEYLVQKREENCKPVCYPIGPLIQQKGKGKVSEERGCNIIKWLGQQPSGSVLYVSFGSGGTLSQAQITELALGLEMSEQRFVWVVRCRNDKISNASYFNIQSDNSNDPLACLPEGFVERTVLKRKQGLVVAEWAPQAQILSHESVGGFLTHCGWNSTLESVVNGVAMIAWPLYAEQRMNAVMLEEEVRVALRVKGRRVMENGTGAIIVGREEVGRVVKALIEGEEGKGIRSRMRELRHAAEVAVGENGASTKLLGDFANKLINHTHTVTNATLSINTSTSDI